MHWLIDAADGGASERMLERARELTAQKRRVWWLTLPSNRNFALRRLAARGATLGAEAVHFQQVHQRVLAQAGRTGTFLSTGLRVARVGEALRELAGGRMPAPGEARLFARAIAELKRFEVAPEEVPVGDGESRRLQRVYAAYERAKGEALDPDDVARLAADLVAEGAWRPETDAVFAAGFWELSPLALSLLTAMERAGVEVWASLPEPPGPAEDPPRLPAAVAVWRAENPVHELRWVLAEIKRDLLVGGFDPLELALVVPPERLEATKMLAREYDLYLMDETYHAPSEEEPGKLLVDLLRFPDHPTAEGLFLFEELAPLGRAALARGLAGLDAIRKLARQLDEAEGGRLAPTLEAVLASLDPLAGAPAEDAARRAHLLAWAERLVDGRPLLAQSRWREVFLLRAREALEAGGPEGFRAWWAGLLERVRLRARRPGGVALLSPREVSGRRYRKAYVLGASEGVYTLDEREDYFIPEEARRPWSEVFERIYAERGVLPRRLRGRDVHLWRSLRALADEVVISYPEADGGRPLEPERDLVGADEPRPMGPVPLVSRALSREGSGYRAPREGVPLPAPSGLSQVYRFERSYGGCGFRSWLEAREGLRPDEDERPEWYRALERLAEAKREGRAPDPEVLARWGMTPARFERLTFFPGVSFGELTVHVHAGEREGRTARVYRFGEEPLTEAEVRERLRDRWAEFIVAGTYLRRGYAVELWYWPLGGPPVRGYGADPQRDRESWVRKFQEMADQRRRWAERALERWRAARAEAVPGWHCRSCPFADVCRKDEVET
ncbi:PD-(D/E)XK nuclease family protein [Oceanithermus desulfurans]